MKRFFKSKCGFTLVELIVSVAILAVISAAVCGFIFSGAGAYSSVYSNVSLQTASQMAMNQIQEYLIDCNGGLAFDFNTLYIINRNDDGTFSEYVFSFSEADSSIEYSSIIINADFSKEYIEGGLMSNRISGFSVSTDAAPAGSTATYWRTESVTINIELTYNSRSYTGNEIIALRNNPYTASTEQALIEAISDG